MIIYDFSFYGITYTGWNFVMPGGKVLLILKISLKENVPLFLKTKKTHF